MSTVCRVQSEQGRWREEWVGREGEKQQGTKREARENERRRAVSKKKKENKSSEWDDHKDKGKQQIATQHTSTKVALTSNNNRSGTTVYTVEQLEY